MSKRKVLHILGRMQRAGAELRTLDIMRNLDSKELELDYLALSGLEGELDEEIRQLGGQVYYIRMNLFSFPVKFIALLKREKIDVVHSQVRSSGYILMLARLGGIRTRVVHFRSPDHVHGESFIHHIRNMILKLLLHLNATHILSINKSSMELVWSKNWSTDKRCHVVYDNVPPNYHIHMDQRSKLINELNLPDEALIFVHVGRFDVPKNHKRLVEIFEAIAQQVDHAYLLVVGNYQTEHAQTVLPTIEKSAYKSCIMLLGVRSDVPEILAGCDALIFPSLWEGMPGVVLEACAAGLPCVVSDLPGCVEIQQHIDVHILKLTDANETWAKRCIQVAQDANTHRESLRQQFTQSPFNLTGNETIATLKALWSE